MSGAAKTKRINLALQGGGAHGAFTWGVLDQLAEDGRLEVDAISGTSAGALNAAAYAYGFEKGEAAGARGMLDAFWKRISYEGAWGVQVPDTIRAWLGDTGLAAGLEAWHAAWSGIDMVSRFVSPYQFNPLNLNPLRDAIEETIDMEGLKACQRTKLFVSATNVRSGKIRVFRMEEITTDTLLASACLPHLFQTVMIDGEGYWDGGYMGNPAIFPLIYNCDSPDVVIVQINPLARDDIPDSAREIQNRLQEISFNSTLMREMRAIAFVTRLVEEGRLESPRYRKLHIHIIEAESQMAALDASTKFNTDFGFLSDLKDLGRETAAAWLKQNFAGLGKRSTVDLEERFL